MKLIGNPHLHGAMTALPGMAFFRGTGPLGTHCVDCLYVDPKSRRRTKADGLTGKCTKFSELMHRIGPAFPLSMSSCRYFEPSGRRKIRTEDFRRQEETR